MNIIQTARILRRNQTDAERLLWNRLRRKQITGLKFRRQHPVGKYIVDFACPEKKLIIELDGGQHADARNKDQSRTEFLEKQGYRVLRFWNNEVFEDLEAVLEVIYNKVVGKAPHPDPPPARGREINTENILAPGVNE